jgi:hypothetical protein
MGGACIMNAGEWERILVIGMKARGKETTRKTNVNVVMNLQETIERLHSWWPFE